MRLARERGALIGNEYNCVLTSLPLCKENLPVRLEAMQTVRSHRNGADTVTRLMGWASEKSGSIP